MFPVRRLQGFIIQAVILCLLGFAQSGEAQTLKRGPYLQTATSTGIIVKWRVALSDSTLDSVHYGTSADDLNLVVTDLSPVAIAFDCGEDCTDPQLEMTVELTGLTPDTRYYYSIGTLLGPPLAEAEAGGTFITSPAPGTPVPTRVWVIGDSGLFNADSQQVRDAYKAYTGLRQADVWLMLGDNAYDDGTDAEYQEGLFNLYPEILRNTPLWPSFGNSDGDSADSWNESGPYYDIFNLPRSGEAGGLASGTEAYYSYDYGNIHFVVLDSAESDLSAGAPMATWLENDLLANDREWIIAYWHHPPYSKRSYDSDADNFPTLARANILPILEQYGADLVLSGHSHAYQRSFFIDGHYSTSDEIVSDPSLILDGGNGRSLPEPGADGAYTKNLNMGEKIPHTGTVYVVVGTASSLGGGSLNHPAMHTSLNLLGSMVLDIHGNRLEASFLGATGQIEDHFTIEHNTPDTFAPEVFSAVALTSSTVSVLFSEPLDSATAENVNNYSIDSGITVLQASLSDDGKRVELSTTALGDGVLYTLTVVNVMDYPQLNTISAPGAQAQFLGVSRIKADFKNGEFPDSSYTGTRDSFIRETSPSLNYGSALVLRSDGSDEDPEEDDVSGELRTVIAWDLSSIPATAQIESVSVIFNASDSSGGEYNLFEIKTSWDESTVNWDTFTGVDALGATPLGLLSPYQLGEFAIPLNQDGVDLVQGWVDGSISNHGFILLTQNTGDGVILHSSEAELSLRPRLTVLYTPASKSPNDILVDFGGPGFWSYMNDIWTKLHGLSPEIVTTGDIDGSGVDDVVVDFGSGVGLWALLDNTTWTPLNGNSPENIITTDLDGNGSDDVVVDFGSGIGLWVYMNNSAWIPLNPGDPVKILTGDLDGNSSVDVLIDFGSGVGLWVWMNNSSWAPLHPSSPEIVVITDLDGNGSNDVLIDFGSGIGLWVYMNNSTWTRLHSLSPEIVTTGDIDGNSNVDVLIDFGSGIGLWAWMNNSAWTPLNPASPELIVTADIDGSGVDDAVVDFGSGIGLWIWKNNSAWEKLHSLSPELVTTGDLDSNGSVDVLIDFGAGIGLWAYMNDTAWTPLNGNSPEIMLTGNIDGL